MFQTWSLDDAMEDSTERWPTAGSSIVRIPAHPPGSALFVRDFFGRDNIFGLQQQAFDRAASLNASLRSPEPRRRRTEMINIGSSDAAVRSGAAYAAYCLESEEPLLRSADGAVTRQTRYFIVADIEHITTYALVVPPEKQHLYEIIRDGEPCALYLDVEKSDEAITDQSGAAGGIAAPDPSQRFVDQRCCPATCTIRHDPQLTIPVLCAELVAYLRSAVGMIVDISDVVVLKSTERSPGRTEKFSFHLILKSRRSCCAFASNIDVGLLVCAFVQALYNRVHTEPRLHAALFYHHGQPCSGGADSVAASDAVATSDELWSAARPLKIVIDEGVYTRNRMFRCLNSCKLGKTAVLQIAVDTHSGPMNTEQWFRHSLVTLVAADRGGEGDTLVPRDTIERAFLAVTAGVRGANARAAMRSYQAALRAWEERALLSGLTSPTERPARALSSSGGTHLPLSRLPVTAAAILSLASVGHAGGSSAASVSTIVVVGVVVLFGISGRRFCRRIGRDHKSNGTYYRVHAETTHVTVQRCHDPECSGFQSAALHLPDTATTELNEYFASLKPKQDSLTVPMQHDASHPASVSLTDLAHHPDPNSLIRAVAASRRTRCLFPPRIAAQTTPSVDDVLGDVISPPA